MNPNAKEFVPAHLLKRRQEEGDQLAEKVCQVDLEDSTKNRSETVTNNTDGDETTNINSTKDKVTKYSDRDQSSNSQNINSNDTSNLSNSNHHGNTNGQTREQDDRHLLKAGESYCEFNGEQFIIPGEDDEYEPDYSSDSRRKAGYDFGNAEDNEDEDVCNAYEQFLDNLPE